MYTAVMAALAVAIIPLGVGVLWLLSPPLLIALALRQWQRLTKQKTTGLRSVWPGAVGVAVLADWILFLGLAAGGQIGGFGTHYITTRLADWFLVISLLLFVGSIAANIARGKLSLASLLVFALWAGSEFVA